MTLPAETLSPLPLPRGVLPALASQAVEQDLDGLAGHLHELQQWLGGDLRLVEAALQATRGEGLAERAAHHLLQAGGKRLRPLCTLLAARVGPQGDEPQARARARELAVAVELVHAATLLHDDVVDLGDERRGQPTARLLHGNEVSIFAGDWLLVEALRRIVGAGLPELVTAALDTIEHMIRAEVEQSQRARTLAADRAGYLRVVDGKTAALFRWALRAGARAGGCDEATEAALVAYGSALGRAFQIGDDLLDLDGDRARTGKALFADLAEGKITLPLALLLELRPDLRPTVVELAAACGRPGWRDVPRLHRACDAILLALRSTGALDAARAVAEGCALEASTALQAVAPGPEVEALRAIAGVLTARRA